MKIGCLFLALFLISTTGFSQRLLFGNSVSFLNPIQDMGRYYQSGFGLKVNMEYEIPGTLAFVGEVGWNRWPSKNFDGATIHAAEAVDVLAGLKVNVIGPLYAEGRTGYYFGGLDKFVLIPAAGLRIRRFDVNIGYQMLNEIKFVDTRIGLYWGRGK
ncbi:MAG TPA: hypothetical protein VIH22_00305 [Cyclobacteriaceae bacterium]|jgi:hypothetical protein